MSTSVVAIVLSFIVCATVSFLLLSNKLSQKIFEEKVLTSVFAIAVSSILVITFSVIFFWHPYDFVASRSPFQYLLPLLCLPLLFGSFFIKKSFAFTFTLLIACTISVFGADLIIDFVPDNPLFINSILTTVLFWLFALGFRTMAGISTLPQIEGMTICLGFVLLYFFGQTPFILTLCVAGLLGSLSVSYFANQKIPLGRDAAPILGFILGWIGLLSYQEFLWPCFLIFSMLYLVELCVALFKKATFLPRYKDIAYNTILVQSLDKKIPVATLVKIIINSSVILIILGVFQLVSNDSFSIPLFAAIFITWELYRAINWKQETKTLKEVNTEIISQIKDSFNNLFSPKKENDDTDRKE